MTRWNGRLFTYRRCGGCGATFVDPLPSAAELDALFAADAYHALHYPSGEPTPAQRASLAWMAPWVRADGSLLDVGCGSGGFLTAAAAAGYRVCGVEQNRSAIAHASTCAGQEVTSLEAVEASGERFDIVHMADLLSHVPDPEALLRRLEPLLAPGGRFFVEGPLEKQPNLVYLALAAGHRLRRALGRRREGEHEPLHLFFASWRSQERFFRARLGYVPLAIAFEETGWPLQARPPAGSGAAGLAKAWLARAAIALSTIPIGRRLGAFNRFRILLEPNQAALR